MNRPDDRPFSPLLFRLYASDLSEAVFKMSVESINAALRDQPLSVDPATEVPVSPFVSQEPKEKPDMSITGLQSGAFKSLLADMKREIADAQIQGIADVKAAKDAAANDIKTAISGVREKIKTEVSDALQEFAEFTNGGPALEQ
jgi:hypothetical protein